MSEKTLKFNNITLNKEELHKSKELIDLMSVNVDQIVLSDKFKHNKEGFNYFIGYQKSGIVKPLCIILPQMSGYIKYFENGGKNMSFLIKDDEVWEKYKQIWDVIKYKISIKFHSKPIYEQKYLLTLGKSKKLVNFLSLGKFEIKHKSPLGETGCLGNPYFIYWLPKHPVIFDTLTQLLRITMVTYPSLCSNYITKCFPP